MENRQSSSRIAAVNERRARADNLFMKPMELKQPEEIDDEVVELSSEDDEFDSDTPLPGGDSYASFNEYDENNDEVPRYMRL